MGYETRNIEAHVAEKGGVLTAAIVAEVAKDLAALVPSVRRRRRRGATRCAEL